MDEIRDRILKAFDDLFPDAFCELNHKNHFELLVAVMLSAQTTDVSVNKVTPALFEKFPTPEAIVQAEVTEIEDMIKNIGLYKSKAKHLLAMSHKLIEQFSGKVPNTREELMELAGVGRKTANVVLSVAFQIPAFAVDTHVDRVSKRLGLASEIDHVMAVEQKVTAFFPIERWNRLHHQMIFFGRYHCTAKKPKCQTCPLFDLCQFKDKLLYVEEK
jgi:endonuclease-3